MRRGSGRNASRALLLPLWFGLLLALVGCMPGQDPRLLLFSSRRGGRGPLPVTPRPPAPVPNDGWRVIGGDEFNGTAIDPTRWKAYHNNYGDGGGSTRQCLTPANVREADGSVQITAQRQQVTCPRGGVRSFTSGFLGSRDVGRYYPKFARFEVRAKLPHGQGLWPAFWLRHRNGAGVAEVDIMEYLHTDKPGQTSGTLHLDGRYNLSKKYVWVEDPAAPAAWHTWGVDIEPAGTDVRFTFRLDGVAYHSYVDTQHGWAAADPNATWDIAVNLAVGGDWGGNPDDALGYLGNLGRCAQGGVAPACRAVGVRRAQFPSTYVVDWVRVSTRT
ncbi:MAG: hypothetical protein JWN46_2689 [Acidimicrobiales bacterium]|nr:hypothetical protein [Acidimicrobiales bacterium]